MRHQLGQAAMVSLVVLAAACSPPPASAPATGGPPAGPDRIVIEVPSSFDVSDIPWFLAVESLQAEGYPIETVSYDDAAVSSLAIERGDLDFASMANGTAWTAAQKGAPIVTILDDSVISHLVVATQDIQECADLNGRRAAIGGLTNTSAILLYAYINKSCPGVQPEYLIIGSSGSRLAALLAGEVDATIVHWDEMIHVENEAAGRFHALVYLNEAFPGITVLSQFARRGMVDEYPETVKGVIRAVLDARRRIQDPQILADEIVKRFETNPDTARATAEIYLDHELWDVNGRFTYALIQQNIEFLVSTESLEPGLRAEAIADLSFLNEVLDEIGRQ